MSTPVSNPTCGDMLATSVPPWSTYVSSRTTNHGPRFLSKAEAELNMRVMPNGSSTEETSQPEMSPLKEVAAENIAYMFSTEETSQPEMSPLKEVAA